MPLSFALRTAEISHNSSCGHQRALFVCTAISLGQLLQHPIKHMLLSTYLLCELQRWHANVALCFITLQLELLESTEQQVKSCPLISLRQ